MKKIKKFTYNKMDKKLLKPPPGFEKPDWSESYLNIDEEDSTFVLINKMISYVLDEEEYKIKLKPLFTELLKDSIKLREPILNLLLVCYGVRPAFLYEETNYINDNKNSTLLFNIIINRINNIGCLKLITKKDNSKFTRIYVYLDESSRIKINPKLYPVDTIIKNNPNSIIDDNEIAKILDFNCIGHNYYSPQINRVEISVFIKDKTTNVNYSIKTEVCEEIKFDRKEADAKYSEFQRKINDVINEYNYECFYEIKFIFSFQTKLDMLKRANIKFIKENLDEYINDLENEYISDAVELERSTTYKKFNDIENTLKNNREYNLLKHIYINMINNRYDSFYKNAHTYHKIKLVSKLLADRDIDLWNSLK